MCKEDFEKLKRMGFAVERLRESPYEKKACRIDKRPKLLEIL